jgi:3-oxoacyl-[acyl-carrier-protein] synthase III
VASSSPDLSIPRGIVEAMTGIRSRRVAAEDLNSSDLAAEASRSVLARTGTKPGQVELLIFASASQDLLEPATANIVQEKVGTTCPVFDVKNACNSFLNGLQVAEALILTGTCQNVLIAVGETPSRCIKWGVRDRDDFKFSFPGYTLGDAGAAALVTPSEDDRGIFYRSFLTVSRYWDVGTLPGGGSMHPRGDEHSYFRGDGVALKGAFAEVGPGLLHQALRETSTTYEDYDRILVHQVALPYFRDFLRESGVPREKVVLTVCDYGNMAAATLPVGFALGEERGEIRSGSKVMWIGLAGGISIGIVCMSV